MLEIISQLTPAASVVGAALIGLLLWRFRSIDKRLDDVCKDIRRRDERMHEKLDGHIRESHDVIQTVNRTDVRVEEYGKDIERLNRKVFNGHKED